MRLEKGRARLAPARVPLAAARERLDERVLDAAVATEGVELVGEEDLDEEPARALVELCMQSAQYNQRRRTQTEVLDGHLGPHQVFAVGRAVGLIVDEAPTGHAIPAMLGRLIRHERLGAIHPRAHIALAQLLAIGLGAAERSA